MSLIEALRVKYKEPAWAVFEEVANETGFNASRRADALAFGIWPSHGHSLHGFEIKSSRSDWLRELRDPDKGDTFLRYCDHFWLVAEPKVALASEIPATWGWMERTSRGLRVVRDAPKLSPEPAPRTLWASMLRSVNKTMVSKATLNAEVEKRTAALQTAYEKRVASADLVHSYDAKAYEALKTAVAQFERLTGLHFDTWTPHETADTINRVSNMTETIRRMQHCQRQIDGLKKTFEDADVQFRRMLEDFHLLKKDSAP